ncbi:PAF1 complex protein [Histomonas meleagridis]|uniref:PAF1 complex protein n=1 Tax=Histomonas meleagridis TaxID=135588 RepID=UPI00355AB035|nr:PAF1 complex protein [Histomonas meleagridis]KAH0805633.1 PAF1 complex protein [Histomonas meleagridis]
MRPNICQSTEKPLHILRDWINEGKLIDAREPGFIKVDNACLDLNLPTEYRSKKGKSEPYTLEQIWFLLINDNIKFPDYVAASKEKGIKNVLYQDREQILGWLKGKFATVKGIVEEKPVPNS